VTHGERTAEEKSAGPTRRFVEFALGTRLEDVPAEALVNAKLSILDALGVSLAAAGEPIAGIVERYVRSIGGTPKATVLVSGSRTSGPLAAFANGTMCHAIDYDDMHFPTIAHPTTAVLPAALAAGELAGASGASVLRGFVLGMETFCKLGGVMNPGHWYRGYHATGTFGAVGAAVAAGSIFGLDEGALLRCLGIAGTAAAGLKQNLGTMTKPFHAGRAAENGVVAALLAADGFTATDRILEGQFGLFRVTTDEPRLGYLDRLGNRWDLIDPGVIVKLFPTCGGTHAAVHALLSLVEEHDLRPEDVEHMDGGMNAIGPEELIFTEPVTALEGKFSMQFTLAAALIHRRLGPAEVSDDVVRDPRVVELMRRVTLSVDPDVAARVPLEEGDMEAVVRVTLRDGSVLERVHRLHPLPAETVTAKFRECVAGRLPEDRADAAIEVVMGLEALPDLGPLFEAVVP
jgi:2-methylcitrate dehydratase PrpD